jgi:predicted dehydrogenase
MKIGIIGCGYVFDHYMATIARHENITIAGVSDRDPVRLARVAEFYDLKPFASIEALLADPSITIIGNFTSIESHYEVTKAAILSGKHVYSEKPFVTDLIQAQELFNLAESRGLRISCAPSNSLSATSQTMWKAVQDHAIGDVRMVYAEFDDNPIYLMSPEGWRSRSGAPWPYLHEYEMGCTWEHVGYHLTWMCAIFGPVRQVTAFSKHTLPDKTDQPLNPANTPDFSVACLDFESGVVGRVTCSIAAPLDHRMRIVGSKGFLHADTYRHYECPVFLEPFGKLSMNARKARTVRTNSLLQWLFGVGGRKIPLILAPPPGSVRTISSGRSKWSFKDLLQRIKRRQLGQQDKSIGLAELVDARPIAHIFRRMISLCT